MATAMQRTTSYAAGNERQRSQLQKRAPFLVIKPESLSNWNVAIPLLSPLAPSSTVSFDQSRVPRLQKEAEKPVEEMKKTQVFKKWQHPASPFCYEKAKRVEAKTNLKKLRDMNYRRENRGSRSSLFDGLDGLEEGRLRASSSYSHDVSERDNDEALVNLQDRVSFLKKVTGDIHEEVESHNRLLDKVGNKMDSARGIMSGTINRFKLVFEKKSNRRSCKLIAYFVLLFLILYYLIRLLSYIKG